MSGEAPSDGYEDPFEEARDFFEFGLHESSRFSGTVVFWVSVPATGGKPARMQYLTVAVRKPGTVPRVQASLTKQKGECIAEMSDSVFFKVYSGKLPTSEVVALCLGGTIKVHWLRYDVLKGLADAMDFSVQRWARFYLTKGMPRRCRQLATEAVGELRAAGSEEEAESLTRDLDRIAAEFGTASFFLDDEARDAAQREKEDAEEDAEDAAAAAAAAQSGDDYDPRTDRAEPRLVRWRPRDASADSPGAGAAAGTSEAEGAPVADPAGSHAAPILPDPSSVAGAPPTPLPRAAIHSLATLGAAAGNAQCRPASIGPGGVS
ncbi:hypothetical protein FNF29_05268 [Cafeteria roenbergensis]|uniref:Uncharacterized protein n=1 Tax=Cafeteria roenbergensis TaxID=33653 RepID=A0A5A8CC13_CAFRO|nr:hypothetical protein FNF29_05268 [Cafeteria roenbergensis]|eukprot:KAA0150465.1 hypothetical protein FNF29_05268 [Cafeteria roenbergensis]